MTEHDYTTLRAIVEALPDPVFVLDEDGRYVDIFGGNGDSPRGLIGKRLHEVLPQPVADELMAVMRDALERDESRVEEYHLRDAEGERWIQGRISPIPGAPRRVAWIPVDITERKRLERELKSVAATDDLTRAGNRRHFMQELSLAIKRESRYRQPFCVLLLDLDHFKVVNDNFGHDAGDQCLLQVAGVIRQELRDSDTLARIGGQEFGILLVNTPMTTALEISERLRQRLAATPFALPGRTLHLTVSGGLTDFRKSDASSDNMLRRAEQALQKSKSAGRDRITIG